MRRNTKLAEFRKPKNLLGVVLGCQEVNEQGRVIVRSYGLSIERLALALTDAI